MPTFVMLTRLAPGSLSSPQALEGVEKVVMAQVRGACPGVSWLASYAVLGPYDYLDLFSAPDIEAAVRVSSLVRTFGHAHTEVWPATDWQRFKELVRDLPPQAQAHTRVRRG
jgi:uncharacterized protein with GYD domain